MPSKRKKPEVAPGVARVTIPPELLDQLVKGPMTPEDVQPVHRLRRQDHRDVRPRHDGAGDPGLSG